MEDKILECAKLIAKSDLSGSADLTWHKICVEILEKGLNEDNLCDFATSDGTHTLGELRQGEIHMMASYLMNFLSPNSFNIAYCTEIQCWVQDFVRNYNRVS